MSTKTIYVVSSGSYSDYHIDGVFSSEEKAKSAIAASGVKDCGIEEWELDPFIPEEARSPFAIAIEVASGNIIDLFKESKGFIHVEVAKTTSVHHMPHWKPEALQIRCWADSEEVAKKIATEKRQEWIAKSKT